MGKTSCHRGVTRLSVAAWLLCWAVGATTISMIRDDSAITPREWQHLFFEPLHKGGRV